MYLKSLEIQGFKAFPDKTVLQFGEDITAVVGPNGSGKSNISDAIRWVMGEQSAKALRGGKMEDVIFSGTARRAPVGFAQVTLVLDNTEHIFPAMEESEVAVTRRYYRSGESEYYINRQSVRLRDVTELFLDTGLGREGYSIIGQGKIDEILSARSGERREIFEEAAGISKFRHRKEESERKLERTEENLVRINDKIAELELHGERREIFEEAAGISKFRHRKEESERKLERTEENLVRINDKIAELELQVEPLRDQAARAKKYLVLRDELRLLEISLWLENLDGLKAGARKLESDLRAAVRDQAARAKKYLVLRDELRLLEISLWLENLDGLKAGARKLESDLRAAVGQREEARAALDALYAEGEQYGERMRQEDLEAETLRTRCGEVDDQIREQASAVAVLESTIRHQEENIHRAQAELEESDSRNRSLEQQAAEQERRMADLDRELAALEEELKSLLEQARAATEQAGGAQSQAETLRGREAMAAAAAADGRARAAAIAAESGQLADRKAAVETELSAAGTQLTQAEGEAKANRRALEDARDEAQAAANIIAGHSLRLEERRKKAAAAGERRVKLTMDAGALENRIRLLTEMERDYEGFSKAVKTEERRKKAAAAGERRVKLTMDAGALENRIRLLTEMERDYEGFSKAVKTVMQAKNSLRGIHGPVASLMKTEQAYSLAIEIALGAGLQNIVVDREEDAKSAIAFLKQRDGPVASLMKTEQAYSLAIEIALGAGLQNIVVDREEDAKSAIAFLKQRDGGRATFLPLTAIRGEELRQRGVEAEPGFVGLASRLVRFDGKYRNIFENLLGRTVIAEDLDYGIAMARKYQNAFRIVTLDGQVINRGGSMTGGSVSRGSGVLSRAAELEKLSGRSVNRGGSMTGGSVSRGSGVLSRAAELEKLSGRSAAMQEALSAAQAEEEAAQRELSAAQYELETAEGQRRQAEDEVLRLEGTRRHFEILLSSLRESLDNLTGELESLNGRLADNARRGAEAQAQVAEQEWTI